MQPSLRLYQTGLLYSKGWAGHQETNQLCHNCFSVRGRDREFATEVYAQNKLTGLIEHKTTNGKSDEQLYRELLEEADIFYEKIYKKYPYFKIKGIHPELLNLIRV